MASKLITQHGYSRDNVKVLLGGWSKWKELNAQDPNGYPIDVTPGAAPGGSSGSDQPAVTVIVNPQPGGSPQP